MLVKSKYTIGSEVINFRPVFLYTNLASVNPATIQLMPSTVNAMSG